MVLLIYIFRIIFSKLNSSLIRIIFKFRALKEIPKVLCKSFFRKSMDGQLIKMFVESFSLSLCDCRRFRKNDFTTFEIPSFNRWRERLMNFQISHFNKISFPRVKDLLTRLNAFLSFLSVFLALIESCWKYYDASWDAIHFPSQEETFLLSIDFQWLEGYISIFGSPLWLF